MDESQFVERFRVLIMSKHAGSKKWGIGLVVTTILGFIIGQIAPPILSKQIGVMISRPLTTWNESMEGFSSFYAQEISRPYPGCSNTPLTTVLDLSPQEVFSPNAQPLADSLVSERVLPWNEASITIVLTVNNPNEAVTITGISAEVYKYEPVQPNWLAYPEFSGCGGAYQRNFELRLSEGVAMVSDQGISEAPGEKPAKIKEASIDSHTWTVSQSDISELTINVRPEDGYYEYGVKIHYILNGIELVRILGPEEKPYKSIGGNVIPKNEYLLSMDGELQKLAD